MDARQRHLAHKLWLLTWCASPAMAHFELQTIQTTLIWQWLGSLLSPDNQIYLDMSVLFIGITKEFLSSVWIWKEITGLNQCQIFRVLQKASLTQCETLVFKFVWKWEIRFWRKFGKLFVCNQSHSRILGAAVNSDVKLKDWFVNNLTLEISEWIHIVLVQWSPFLSVIFLTNLQQK